MTRLVAPIVAFTAAAGLGWQWGHRPRDTSFPQPRGAVVPLATRAPTDPPAEALPDRGTVDVPLTLAGLLSVADPLNEYATRRRMAEALGTAGVDDLRRLVASGEWDPLPPSVGREIARALAERWLEVDAASVEKLLFEEKVETPADFAFAVLAGIARTRPGALVDRLGSPDSSRFSRLAQQTVRALSSQADFDSFEAAAAALGPFLGPMTERMAGPEGDSGKLKAGSNHISEPWREFLERWMARDPGAVERWASAQPAVIADNFASWAPLRDRWDDEFTHWAKAGTLRQNKDAQARASDPRATLHDSLERCLRNGEPENQPMVMRSWIADWANRDPAVAAEWLREKGPVTGDTQPLTVAAALARTDGPTAFEFARSFAEPLRWQVVQTSLMEWARRDFQAASRAAQELPAGPSWENALTGLAEVARDRPAAEAVEWAAHLPVTVRDTAARKLFVELAEQQPVEAAQHLATWLTSGREVDAGTIAAVAGEWGDAEPDAAAEWALQLPPEAKDRALERILPAWRSCDPEAAEAWEQQHAAGTP